LLCYVSFCDRDKYVFRDSGWLDGRCIWRFTSSAEFIDGAQRDFIPFHIAYAFIKTLIFAMLCNNSFFPWLLHEGALEEVGKASTVAFVWTSVCIILF
jgi:phospholipid/cholesterol/gamma-HCH transport system permease protein